MLQLNFKSGVPICDQIVNGFIRMKALGLVESGEQLPSVRQLAVKLGVNPNTIQKAYQILESAALYIRSRARLVYIGRRRSRHGCYKSGKARFPRRGYRRK